MKSLFKHIPNILSGYRILAFPFIIGMVWAEMEQIFVILLCTNLITDILDGYIARRFKLQTELGARLDSIGDTGTYIAAFYGIYQFQMEAIQGHFSPLLIFTVLYLLSIITAFVKFRGLIGMHLWAFKITGYVQGSFIFVWFAFEFYYWYYILAMTVGIYACAENIIALLFLKEPRTNVKTIFHLIKTGRSES